MACAAAYLVGKVLALVYVVRGLLRERLLSGRFICRAAAAWLVLTGLLLAAAAWLGAAEPMLFVFIALLVPLAGPLAAPLALEHNRHR
jgi:hypothetical protein